MRDCFAKRSCPCSDIDIEFWDSYAFGEAVPGLRRSALY